MKRRKVIQIAGSIAPACLTCEIISLRQQKYEDVIQYAKTLGLNSLHIQGY